MSLEVSEDEEENLNLLDCKRRIAALGMYSRFVCSTASADVMKEYFSIFVEEIMQVISMSKRTFFFLAMTDLIEDRNEHGNHQNGNKVSSSS